MYKCTFIWRFVEVPSMIMIILWTTSGKIQWLYQKKLVNVKYTCANSLAPNTLGPRDATSLIHPTTKQHKETTHQIKRRRYYYSILHAHYTTLTTIETYATNSTRSRRLTPLDRTSFKLSLTPTMITDRSSWAVCTRAALVASMSLISPSVMISSTLYFCFAWLCRYVCMYLCM